MKVLIADDSQFMRKAISQFVEGDVVEASNEDEAVRLYKEHKPDITFLDVMMDDTDSGVKALRRIKEEEPNARIVLITSLQKENNLVQEALELGVEGYISKPFEKDQIMKFLN